MSATLTPFLREDGTIDITKVRAELVNRASPGPWLAWNTGARVNGTPAYSLKAVTAPLGMDCTWIADISAEYDNAPLMAASRELVPALCDRVEDLERQLEDVRSRLAHCFPARPEFSR